MARHHKHAHKHTHTSRSAALALSAAASTRSGGAPAARSLCDESPPPLLDAYFTHHLGMAELEGRSSGQPLLAVCVGTQSLPRFLESPPTTIGFCPSSDSSAAAAAAAAAGVSISNSTGPLDPDREYASRRAAGLWCAGLLQLDTLLLPWLRKLPLASLEFLRNILPRVLPPLTPEAAPLLDRDVVRGGPKGALPLDDTLLIVLLARTAFPVVPVLLRQLARTRACSLRRARLPPVVPLSKLVLAKLEEEPLSCWLPAKRRAWPSMVGAPGARTGARVVGLGD